MGARISLERRASLILANKFFKQIESNKLHWIVRQEIIYPASANVAKYLPNLNPVYTAYILDGTKISSKSYKALNAFCAENKLLYSASFESKDFTPLFEKESDKILFTCNFEEKRIESAYHMGHFYLRNYSVLRLHDNVFMQDALKDKQIIYPVTLIKELVCEDKFQSKIEMRCENAKCRALIPTASKSKRCCCLYCN